MNALVTGGAGFIGSNLVRRLVDRGDEVVVLDDLSTGFETNLPGSPRARFIKGDVRDARLVKDAAVGMDVIFHLAASVGNARSIANPRLDAEINVFGTLNVLEAARAARARKIVFSSSAGIFGELRRLPIVEDHPAEPDSPYGVSKLAAEKHCLVYAKLFGLETICLRYFNVYGINQRYDVYGNVIPIFVHCLLRGDRIVVYGDGEQTRDFVNVTDVVSANVLAADARSVVGAFNIGSGTSITINELVRAIERAAGMKAAIDHLAPRKGDVRHSRADISAAAASLGYRPSSDMEAGLREYCNWVQAEGLAKG